VKVSDYIVDFLLERDIDKVFSYIGKNAHICDSIDKAKDIENIFSIHEQGAGFSADAYARMTGKSAVVTVTSGPGATNVITSIADCYFDSIPSFYIVGDLSPNECKGSRPIRQFGFQETDIVELSKPITKYAVSITNLEELRYELEKAYFISQEGRKGPVLISLPETLQFLTNFEPKNEKSFFDSQEYTSYINKEKDIAFSETIIEETKALISKASRPLILVGGGVRLADASHELKQLLEQTNIPIVYSLMGKDAISDEYAYNLGFLGNFGTRHANLTIANCDLLIVLGSRLDNLQTGRKIETFAKNAKVIQVDIDKNELGIRMPIHLSIQSDLKNFLIQLNAQTFKLSLSTWHRYVLELKKKYPAEYALDGSKREGNQIIEQLSKHLKVDDSICVDVGEHQMLVAQSLKTKKGQRVLFSGAFGAMGFALPAAIGATLSNNKRAIVITGDGGFQMNIQELEVIKRRNLAIKIFVINNASLHMVKLRQDAYLESNHVGSKKDYSVPSFKKIAEAYGIKSHEASTIKEIYDLIEKSLENDEPELLDIQISGEMTTVEPRLNFNRSFEDMRPYLERDELKKQMFT